MFSQGVPSDCSLGKDYLSTSSPVIFTDPIPRRVFDLYPLHDRNLYPYYGRGIKGEGLVNKLFALKLFNKKQSVIILKGELWQSSWFIWNQQKRVAI